MFVADWNGLQRRGPGDALQVLQGAPDREAQVVLPLRLVARAGPLVRHRAGLGGEGGRSLHISRAQGGSRPGELFVGDVKGSIN